jgi:hypothetical protein
MNDSTPATHFNLPAPIGLREREMESANQIISVADRDRSAVAAFFEEIFAAIAELRPASSKNLRFLPHHHNTKRSG